MLKDESKSATNTGSNTEGGGPAELDEFRRTTAKTAVDLLRPRFSAVSDELSKLLTETETFIRIAVAEALYEEVSGQPIPGTSSPSWNQPALRPATTPSMSAPRSRPPYSMPQQSAAEIAANRRRPARKGDQWVGPCGPGKNNRPYLKLVEVTGPVTVKDGPHKGKRKLGTKVVWTNSPAQTLGKLMFEENLKADYRLHKKAPH